MQLFKVIAFLMLLIMLVQSQTNIYYDGDETSASHENAIKLCRIFFYVIGNSLIHFFKNQINQFFGNFVEERIFMANSIVFDEFSTVFEKRDFYFLSKDIFYLNPFHLNPS